MDSEGRAWVWAWFKPDRAPDTVCLQVPDEGSCPTWERTLPLQSVLEALAIETDDVLAGTLYGLPFEADSSVFQRPLDKPEAGRDSTITIFVKHQREETSVATAEREIASTEIVIESTDVFIRLETIWQTVLRIEYSLFTLRQEFQAMLMRVNALNRELSADESRAIDNSDRRDWQACRQWMRDVVAMLTRSIRIHDLTRNQFADKRGWLEVTYAQSIIPRRHFDGIEQVEQEFQTYFGTVQSLLAAMNSIRDPGWQQAERKVYHTMNRISYKSRANRLRR